MPYQVVTYNTQDTGRQNATQAAFDAMEADGWEVHTANLNFSEHTILWYKPAQKKEEPADEGRHSRARTAAKKP